MEDIGRINKNKGKETEDYYAEIFRKNGFPNCKVSDKKDKIFDNAGIDLIGLPFNVQIKAGKHKNMNISYVLHDITSRIKTMLGDRTASFLPVILIHKKDVAIERNRNDFDEIVSMSFKDFLTLLKQLK